MLISSCLLLTSSILGLIRDYRYLPVMFGFINFLVVLSSLTIVIVTIIDLVSDDRRTTRGRIINIEGKIINILNDDGKLKRYKIMIPEILEQLKTDQRVEVLCTKLSKLPCEIRHIQEDIS